MRQLKTSEREMKIITVVKSQGVFLYKDVLNKWCSTAWWNTLMEILLRGGNVSFFLRWESLSLP
jgi:hypothetical protein